MRKFGMEICNGFGEMDLANKIPRLKLILEIVQMIKNGPMSKQTLLLSFFSKTKCENISMKQLTFMWFRRKFTTITRYISEPVSETDDLIKY